MILTELKQALNTVETTFNERAAGFLPLARAMVKAPVLDLSRVLLGTMALGRRFGGEASICACRALEFLDQALALGSSASDDSYDEDRLLVTDYLYGQAIDQLIEAEEPAVIGILASTIAGAAEDKLEPDCSDYRIRLVPAALDISLILGDFDRTNSALVERMRAAAAGGGDDWRAPLPAGAIYDFMHSPCLAVKAE